MRAQTIQSGVIVPPTIPLVAERLSQIRVVGVCVIGIQLNPKDEIALLHSPAGEFRAAGRKTPSAFADGVWLVIEEPILPEGVVIGISHHDVVDDVDL